MIKTHSGWLFGLTGSLDEIRLPSVVIRRMTEGERNQICARAIDFFVHDQVIWRNSTKRFPYLYSKQTVGETSPIGGEDFIGVLLSILAPGEVRTPIQWIDHEQGPSAMASDSGIVSLFFRSINGQFQEVNLDLVADSLSIALHRLQRELFLPAHETLGSVLLDRLLATKAHPISQEYPVVNQAQLIARAADIAMMLEYLFHEGSTSEVSFRLGMSVAWLLGSAPDERKRIIDALKITYELRSKRVHGVTVSSKLIREETLKGVTFADCLLRRSILARILAGHDEEDWKKLFISARVGGMADEFDRVHWLQR